MKKKDFHPLPRIEKDGIDGIIFQGIFLGFFLGDAEELEEIILPSGIIQIHSTAFDRCQKCRSIIFPDSIDKITLDLVNSLPLTVREIRVGENTKVPKNAMRVLNERSIAVNYRLVATRNR